ncbi:MAG: endopeptidase La [Oscillospiraceae bacterium]|nr:endopeptidase La [Oscillospiraceae bacterium]
MPENTTRRSIMPVLPLRGLTAFPHMMLNFDVGRDKSMKSLDDAMAKNQNIFLVAQKEIRTDNPTADDIYSIGTVAKVKQVLRFPANNVRVLVEGIYRAKIVNVTHIDPFIEAEVEELITPKARENSVRCEALMRSAQELFSEYLEYAPKLAPDVMLNVISAETMGDLADYIAQSIPAKFTNKQEVLEELHPYKRLTLVSKLLARELEIFKVESNIAGKVQEQMDKNQRDYFLREQMKAIHEELGDDDDVENEYEGYLKKIHQAALPDEVNEKLIKEASRLRKMQYNSPESSVVRTYLDTVLELPWNKATKDKLNIESAKKVLDRDHYGMEKVKERILEFLAVKKLNPESSGQIICLVGPPGVGKTSIGKSIAQAMGRRFARLSLGGVRDEADIRGHRKTYIGSMPGRIMNAVKTAGSKNALILLDEIDKMSSDFRGDPSAAMLEVLDIEQNVAFRDHYLEIPFDLSDVLFVTTANTTSTIPLPLLDRMEVIELTSYTVEDKFHIAKNHLIKKQMKKNGITSSMLKISDDAVYKIISDYTREAGVRTLEREIGTLMRKVAKAVVSQNLNKIKITAQNLSDYLGVEKYKDEKLSDGKEAGVVNGLAWTSVGGEILEVEVNVVEGSGKLEITGNLGTVMNESAKAALTYVRSRVNEYNIAPDFYKTRDIHIHFPEGAIPKDGPSAGITIATALVSALTQVPARNDIAMTGEISIRGRVLPIGGLKEKTMAAYRHGIKTVIIPEDNMKDLEEIDTTVRSALSFCTAAHADEVIRCALDLSKVKKCTQKEENTAYTSVVEKTQPQQGSVSRIRQ